jgi:hypothetical protein
MVHKSEFLALYKRALLQDLLQLLKSLWIQFLVIKQTLAEVTVTCNWPREACNSCWNESSTLRVTGKRPFSANREKKLTVVGEASLRMISNPFFFRDLSRSGFSRNSSTFLSFAKRTERDLRSVSTLVRVFCLEAAEKSAVAYLEWINRRNSIRNA